jgi:hypothetical protein
MCYRYSGRPLAPTVGLQVVVIAGAYLQEAHVRQETARVHHVGRRRGSLAIQGSRAAAKHALVTGLATMTDDAVYSYRRM